MSMVSFLGVRGFVHARYSGPTVQGLRARREIEVLHVVREGAALRPGVGLLDEAREVRVALARGGRHVVVQRAQGLLSAPRLPPRVAQALEGLRRSF